MFLIGATPTENVEHGILMKWSVAIMSFATDCIFVWTVAKSSSATDQLCACKAQHCNRSYGDCRIAASQVVSVTKLSIAPVAAIVTVAAIAINHVAVAKLSIATIAAVATNQVISVAMPLLQPSQPSQHVNYLGTDLSGFI
jgi:hypothetical protein